MDIYTQEFLTKFPSIDLSEYFEFIESHKIQRKEKFVSENHHILPQWAFPEFKSFTKAPWNKAILKTIDHLKAHLILFRNWKHVNNMHPLRYMFPKITTEIDLQSLTEEYIDEIVLAKDLHSKTTSEFFSGYKFSEEHNQNISKSRSKYIESLEEPMVNAISLTTGENCYITCKEYNEFKNIKYIMHSTGKPSWNSGISNTKCKDKLSVYLIETNQLVFITTDEYWVNKHLYRHPRKDKESPKVQGMTPIIIVETGERKTVPMEEYNLNKHLYKHPASDKIWFNDGVINKRFSENDIIPNGFIRGRIKSQLKGHKKKTIICPNCGLEGGAGNMKRYHFDNCKFKTSNNPVL
jgi:hypothetical protein